jgi:hypothetical protein
MSGRDPTARVLEAKLRRQTKARLRRARAEGRRVVKVKVAEQGLVAEAQARAACAHVKAELAEQGIVAEDWSDRQAFPPQGGCPCPKEEAGLAAHPSWSARLARSRANASSSIPTASPMWPRSRGRCPGMTGAWGGL